MASTSVRETGDLDLDGCDREPIRIPGSIQPHGALFALEPESGRIVQAAIGPEAGLGADPDALLGRALPDVLGRKAGLLLDGLQGRIPETGSLHLGTLAGAGGTQLHAITHRTGGLVVVELEAAAQDDPASFDQVYPHVRDFLAALEQTQGIEDVAALAAREVRRLTGLDRALVYRFDPEWNGEVVAEDRNDTLPSLMGQRFPASDIPAQARELYRLNRLRLIADANYRPVPIAPATNPLDGKPLDLSFAVLRSVSPVHLEYMRNMGTMASMSISLLRDGQLWGLISCHNAAPRRVPYHVRMACDFIGQMLSMQLAARENHVLAERRQRLRAVQTRLLADMAAADQYIDGLLANQSDLLGLTGATGAVIVVGGVVRRIGRTPGEAEIAQIVEWLAAGRRSDLFVTDCLSGEMPESVTVKDEASGLLAISISQIHDSYLLWFRPEVIRTVTWGGDPTKRAEPDASGALRLHPRKSFEAWQETVRLRSRAWDIAEIEAAGELRTAIVDIVLRKAEETAALSDQLTASNRELEAFSYSVSHDLRAPFRHIVGYAELLTKFEGDRLTERGNRFVRTIIDAAVSAGELVDDLLSFSQMGRTTLRPVAIDMNELVQEVRRTLSVEDAGNVDWRIEALPGTRADPTMLRLVLQNLLDNALKFSRGREQPVIEISASESDGEIIYAVADNGSGFDMAYVGKLFGVFQRLHRVEDFEGTGIGLANVKRIVERHGGRVWAQGEVGRGATFFFSMPKGETRS